MKLTRRHRLGLGIAASAAALSLTVTGCSEIVGLAAPGTINVTYPESATVNLLLDEGYTITVKPVCDVEGAGVMCSGEVASGESITAKVPDLKADDPHLTIRIGDDEIYDGSMNKLLVKGMRADGHE